MHSFCRNAKQTMCGRSTVRGCKLVTLGRKHCVDFEVRYLVLHQWQYSKSANLQPAQEPKPTGKRGRVKYIDIYDHEIQMCIGIIMANTHGQGKGMENDHDEIWKRIIYYE